MQMVPIRQKLELQFWHLVVQVLRSRHGRLLVRGAYRTGERFQHLFAEAPLWKEYVPFVLVSAFLVYVFAYLSVCLR